MRYICLAGVGTSALIRQHRSPPSTSAESTRLWQRLAGKHALLAELREEQYQLCCYSEINPDELNLGAHIEHVVNKSADPARTFDYQNLAACALSSDDLASRDKKDVFGGHAAGKRGAVNFQQFVSPHMPGCRDFFVYLSDGRVVPAGNPGEPDFQRADYTITLLNLNAPYLVILRRNWWKELDELWEEHQQKNWNLPDLAAVDLVPTGTRLSRFFSLTRQYFGRIAETVLQQQAPQLV